MRVALPVWQERVSPVLDVASRLLVVTCRRGKRIESREFTLGPLSSEALAQSVAELGVDVLLCAAVSEPLMKALEQRGVHVRPHLCGEVEPLLEAFFHGGVRRSEFRMPGCWGWHFNGGCTMWKSEGRNPKSETRNPKLEIQLHNQLQKSAKSTK